MQYRNIIVLGVALHMVAGNWVYAATVATTSTSTLTMATTSTTTLATSTSVLPEWQQTLNRIIGSLPSADSYSAIEMTVQEIAVDVSDMIALRVITRDTLQSLTTRLTEVLARVQRLKVEEAWRATRASSTLPLMDDWLYNQILDTYK